MIELESRPVEKEEYKKPRLWKVIVHNDDVTDFHFVERILMEFFDMSPKKANRLAVEVDKNGSGVAGIYSKEVAEIKIMLSMQEAKNFGYPLRMTLEVEEE